MLPFRVSGTGTPTESLLIVGVPGEDLPADADAGMVQIFRVTSTRAVTERPRIHQDIPGVDGGTEPGDLLGEGLAVVNTAPNATTTAATVLLAVGVPGEDLGDERDAGAVQTFPLSGAPGEGDVWIEQGGDTGIDGDIGPQEYVGTSVAATSTALYVGIPYGSAATGPCTGCPGPMSRPASTPGTVQSWRPGEDGLPADDVTAFGAVVR